MVRSEMFIIFLRNYCYLFIGLFDMVNGIFIDIGSGLCRWKDEGKFGIYK